MTGRMLQGAAVVLLGLMLTACGGGTDAGDTTRGEGGPGQGARPASRPGGEGGGHGPGGGPGGPGASVAAVPVEVATVTRRAISAYIETNGTLEAETEVDIVARTSGPVVEINVEEGDQVRRGNILARLDEQDLRARLEIARVNLNESKLAWERAEKLQQQELISPEAHEQARSAHETAEAEFDSSNIQLSYTEIRAPFDGLIVRRYVDFSEHVAVGAGLFRISDFTPLLCPIQVPERELNRLHLRQGAYLTVEAFPGESFDAEVLRISPVVDADTGTIRVTLEVAAREKLRPGMFARVFVETDTRPEALVIPKAALSLESIGDTVYVADGDTASRREVELGYTEGDFVEVLSGVREDEPVVVVGQDGLSDGTPIRVLSAGGSLPAGDLADDSESPDGDTPRAGPGGRGPGPRFDVTTATPEQLERMKKAMRARGLTEEQIEERLRLMRERAAASSS